MTNYEKFQDEIITIVTKNKTCQHPAVKNGVPIECLSIHCSDCDLLNPCDKSFIRWLFKEYKEPKPKLTHRQRAFCEAVQTGWLSRSNSTERLWLFRDYPPEYMPHFYLNKYDGAAPLPDLFPDFPFIKSGEDAFSIELMLTWEVEGE